MLSMQLLCLLLSASELSTVANALSGITGTQSGYDTVFGQDAICWESYRSNISNSATSSIVGNSTFPIEGLSNSSTSNAREVVQVSLLSACPSGTYLRISPPKDFLKPEPLTQTEYNYTIHGQIDLTGMNGLEIASDSGFPRVKVEILACRVSSSFCSPFVHEETEMAHIGTSAKGSIVAGGSHGGTHVDMGSLVIELEPSASMIYTFEVHIPTRINEAGIYTIIGVVKFFSGSSASTPEFRYDIANAVTRREGYDDTRFSDAPILSKVRTGAYIFAYSLVGISSAILVVMIWFTIKYYKSQVLQICQAPFLLVYQIAALMAVLSSILLEPKNDAYCNWSLPLVMIPVQLHYAITLGRLYRIHTVVSPLLSDHFKRLDKRRIFLRLQMTMLSFCLHGRCATKEDEKQIRRTVRPRQVVCVIAMWTIPQVVFQIVRLAIQPFKVRIQYQDDFSLGRPACSQDHFLSEGSFTPELTFYSLVWLGIQGLTVVGMAYVSRGLPSLLNESRALYSSLITSLLATIVIFTAIALSNTPDASPGLRFVLLVCEVLILVMVPTVRIVGPKLVLAHSGMKILLHKMIVEHNKQTKPPAPSSLGNSPNVHVSGTSFMNPSLSPSPSAIGRVRGTTLNPKSSQMTPVIEEGVVSGKSEDKILPEGEKENTEMHSQDVWLSRSIDSRTNEDSSEQSLRPTNARDIKSGQSDGSQEEGILLIRSGEAPPIELVRNMIDLQFKLDRITKKICYGIEITAEDWNLVSLLSEQLESQLSKVQLQPGDFLSNSA